MPTLLSTRHLSESTILIPFTYLRALKGGVEAESQRCTCLCTLTCTSSSEMADLLIDASLGTVVQLWFHPLTFLSELRPHCHEVDSEG